MCNNSALAAGFQNFATQPRSDTEEKVIEGSDGEDSDEPLPCIRRKSVHTTPHQQRYKIQKSYATAQGDSGMHLSTGGGLAKDAAAGEGGQDAMHDVLQPSQMQVCLL